MTFRIGQGIDVHAFDTPSASGSAFVTLGGVRIPHEAGLLAHSDGDVVLHALCDALLGALALGDIGQLYPDSDPQYQGADSRALLRDVVSCVRSAGFELVNADLTVVAERPKISQHSESMRDNIASDCGVSIDAVSIKATTSEKLGFTGRGEGIACFAVALLAAPGQINKS